MTSDIDQFWTSSAQLAYSAESFALMTFKHAVTVTLPEIMPPMSLKTWCFQEGVLADAAATLIHPGELIPHVDDLLPIVPEIKVAFLGGSRSVALCFDIAGEEIILYYHFLKVHNLQTRCEVK